jgi:Undecaprenyl-phosphate galactose phosphotransferase WbaP
MQSHGDSHRQSASRPLYSGLEKATASGRRATMRYLARVSKRLGQMLLKNGDVRDEHLMQALKTQQKMGGLLGTILLQMGACTIQSVTRALLHQSPAVETTGAVQSVEADRSEIGLKLATCPRLTIAVLIGMDVFCLILAGIAGIVTRSLIDGGIDFHEYLKFLPVLGLFIASFAVWHLYPLVALSPVEELRRTTLAISAVCLAVVAATYFLHVDSAYSRLVVLVAWACAVLIVPLGRAMVRGLFARKAWWGHPVLVFGAGKTGRMLVRTLRKNPGLGLKPVALLDDNPDRHGTVEAVPVIGRLQLAPVIARDLRVQYALIAMPGVPHRRLLELIERYGSAFSHLHVIPDLFGFSSLGVPTKDFGGVLGLEVRQQLLLPLPCIVKRSMDVVFAISGGLCILPILAILALLIKLDSKGSAFYIQRRLGRDGEDFDAFKFRTMHGDGEKRLTELLNSSPELRKEYETYHKLKNDPRITRFGRFLRKYSLDELPQLWNVIKGEMSLVGPRPYLEREIPEMGDKRCIILRALPGMTGMWQVNGRNRALFSERLEMDVHYVRNWSPWLDIYLLARTFSVVISGSGN